ncbi:MAG: SPFH domain-containing protein [Candidatus Limivicinus sp.]|jgi:membrane protease subunit (stomatin/prohibitin family)
MGLISAALGSAGGVLADQWKEYFYCDSLRETVLAVKGQKRVSGRSSNRKGSDNIITDGSVIAVADGQCMLIVEQGKIVDVCAEPGEYIYNSETEPSVFAGSLGDGILEVFSQIGKRFEFGGEAPKDQRVYYINVKEIIGNKFGTPSAVPFRVIDKNIGLDLEINVRCFGEYSYHIANPLLFYTNVCGNITEDYTRDRLESQMKAEFLMALQPAFTKIADMGIRYYTLPGHSMELADALNEVLSKKWGGLRGIEIVSLAVASIKATEEDEQTIKQFQRSAALRDPTMAAGHLVNAQADAMRSAATNQATGAGMAFMGMNMAANAGGMNAANLYQMGQQQQYQQPQYQPQQAAPAADSWKCPKCGAMASGKFCPECGTKKPAPANSWTCPECGAANKGKFCSECGAKKPAGVPQYKCDKCGWEPKDPTHPPRFCPECGDPFDNGDIV